MKDRPQRQLVIVGGGILGLMAAHSAYKRGFNDITIYESPGKLNLNADTLRNHAWFQSGLLYAKTNRVTAKILSQWGRRMLEEFGAPVPKGKGVFRCCDDGQAEDEFLERAAYLLLSSQIRRLDEAEARSVLGPFFRHGFVHYWVPDVPFDEALLVYKARQRAKARNIHLRRAAVSLRRDEHAAMGFLIDLGSGEAIESEYVILCAGAGLLSLLETLGVTHPLAVFRSALLRVANGSVMKTSLLVDISSGLPTSGLSVVQHAPTLIPPNGCLVLGSKDRVRLQADEVERERQVTRDEDEKLQGLVPSGLLPSTRGVKLRVGAGHKTEACDVDGNPSVTHWIGQWPEYRHLIAAVPGKATQALFVAEQILDRLLASGHQPRTTRDGGVLPPGEESVYTPRMLYHHCYDGVLDEIEQ